MDEIKKTDERLDSIEVSQGASGKFTFKIKRYYDFSCDDPNIVIESIKKIYNKLGEKFKQGE